MTQIHDPPPQKKKKEKENVGILRAPSLKRPIRAPDIQRALTDGGTLLVRGALMIKSVPDVERGPGYQRAPDRVGRALTSREPLMLRGPLIFIVPLTVGRAPDIHKDH